MINKYLFFILLTVISLLAGCEEESALKSTKPIISEQTSFDNKQNLDYKIQNAKSAQFKIGEQKFEIVPVFESNLKYIKEAKVDEENYKQLYQSKVIEPFRKEVFGETGGHGFEENSFFAPPINIDRLYESIILLDEEYEQLITLIQEALIDSTNLLPSNDKISIYLYPFNPDEHVTISQYNGVFGLSIFTTEPKIVLHIAPQKYTEEILQYTVAHNYHYIAHLEKNPTVNKDLVNHLLSKGKADTFANMIYPTVNVPWTRLFSLDDVEKIWNWVKERRYSFDLQDLIDLRTGTGNLYYWSDYRMGYQIMQNFIEKNPETSVEEWTYMDSDEILEKTDFDFANK